MTSIRKAKKLNALEVLNEKNASIIQNGTGIEVFFKPQVTASMINSHGGEGEFVLTARKFVKNLEDVALYLGGDPVIELHFTRYQLGDHIIENTCRLPRQYLQDAKPL